MKEKLYNRFSDFLKDRYQARVYKLPVNIPCTCPNRDGTLSRRGCIFCGSEGAGFETHPASVSVREQLQKNMAYIGRRYKADRFIAYFQSFSSTYLDPESFSRYLEETLLPGVVAVYISTRPDWLAQAHLSAMKSINEKGLDVVVELGLQSVTEDTLRFIHRGHGVEAFTKAAALLKREGIGTGAHVITDFPSDSKDDVISCARYLNSLGIDQVKCHSLYILEGTELGDLYQQGIFLPLDLESFIERTIAFLEALSPHIIVQRLLGRAPEDRVLYANFGMSWWKVQAILEEKMRAGGRFQGRLYTRT